MKSSIETLSEFTAGDTLVRYLIDKSCDRVGLLLLPVTMTDKTVRRRAILSGGPEYEGMPDCWKNIPAVGVDSLVQLKLSGSANPGGAAAGRTMRNAADTIDLKYANQCQTPLVGGGWKVMTALTHRDGQVEHELIWDGITPALESRSTFINQSKAAVKLEMLSSFSLGAITPFDRADAPRRLIAHRFRSAWSAEGFLESTPFEKLHLERSWTGYGVRVERFGQVGTMPVRGFHPWAAVEDRKAGVCWGAYLAWAGSWQMEFYRRDDTAALSGGLADRELGHWMKTVLPGERFTSPTAYVACCEGDVDVLCDRLRAPLEKAALAIAPEVERDMPVMFNEWCTTWGDPSAKRMAAIAERLRGTPVKYLIMDAGWYKPDISKPWGLSHGDWVPNTDLFPNGLQAVADHIRTCGMIPGIWFEYETAGRDSKVWNEHPEWFLTQDGVPVTDGARRFLDLNNPEVVRYLNGCMTELLRRMEFGYLKVDYNSTLGIGCDHPDSLGEGIRQQIEATYRFLKELHATLPELVIENCASGGNRLEPSMMALNMLASSSDAHETPEIPVVSANLQRLIPSRQSQIWAVLRAPDDEKRLRYSLAATFLGRMCLSGDLPELTEAQWSIAKEAMEFYRKVWPVIADGTSRRFGPTVDSHRHLRGGQAVLRIGANGTEALLVAHGFGPKSNFKQTILLPSGNWSLTGRFGLPDAQITQGRTVQIDVPAGDGGVLLLKKTV
jgi:alpha-galactosidase